MCRISIFFSLLILLFILLILEAVGSTFLSLSQPSAIKFWCKDGTNSQEPYSCEGTHSCHPFCLFVTSHSLFQMSCRCWSTIETFLCCDVLKKRRMCASIHHVGLFGDHHEWDMWALSLRCLLDTSKVNDTGLIQYDFAPIELETNFQHMCHMYHMFNKMSLTLPSRKWVG